MLKSSARQRARRAAHLTKLHRVARDAHQRGADVEQVVAAVPLGKDGLVEVGVHDVLDAPDVVAVDPRRELLADHAHVLPLAAARLVRDLVGGDAERLVQLIGDEAVDDDVAVGVVLV